MNQSTPLALRKQVGIFGNTNAGKSALFNKLLNQELSIVSEYAGTTTDPVSKGMELLPYGPITLIDTAGANDITVLGEERYQKTKRVLDRCDYILYVVDATQFSSEIIEKEIKKFGRTPYTLIFTKIDLLENNEKLLQISQNYPDSKLVSILEDSSILELKRYLSKQLEKSEQHKESMIAGLVPTGAHVVMVVPLDSEAPKGRLILPQVTFLRDCLDAGIICTVTKETQLQQTLEEIKKVDLVVTDSQIFKPVAQIVPETILLTSFSMLLANQKADIKSMLDACNHLRSLQAGDKILMLEACTHNHTHEDIGRVKIPALLQKTLGISLNFDYYISYDFPENISEYQFAIHCGGCMIARKEFLSRIEKCKTAGVPITNYGVVLAYLSGISKRCSEVFLHE